LGDTLDVPEPVDGSVVVDVGVGGGAEPETEPAGTNRDVEVGLIAVVDVVLGAGVVGVVVGWAGATVPAD
jgi:hypothetical protein